ncbi:MAG TPA: uracil-DNA glycosylase [Weissella thailandensis]|uniref:uracil-DNA glycosylase n=1 Tax=Weissella thailandensis TaxID=89061 RepID=UPI001DD8EC95|nr:uracil-DNA glycosylase [Weissella thailandensis]HJG84368.1 uracil-DNA glycosylase [Weissella thailandensis]
MPELLPKDWAEALQPVLQPNYIGRVQEFLDTVYLIDTVYPERQNVFAALKETPLDKVKVVILGQDPYPNPDQAQGLSFSVPATMALPKSLINIYKELVDDLNVDAPKDGDLRRWAKQGVLLLNTVLTVPAHHAGGHAGEVWEPLTDEIIKLVAQRGQATVFILWGKQAQNKKSLIQGEKNLVLQAPHPSPLSAYRGFFGSKPFSQTNDFLQKNNRLPIKWA